MVLLTYGESPALRHGRREIDLCLGDLIDHGLVHGTAAGFALTAAGARLFPEDTVEHESC